MLKNKLSELIDRALLFLVTAFFSIAVAGYFSREPLVIITVGVSSALLVTALLGFLLKKRKPTISVKEVEETMLQFFLQGNEFCLDTVFHALQTRYEPEKHTEYILVNQTAVYPFFSPEPLSFVQFCALYAKLNIAGIRRILILTAAGTDAQTAKTASLLPNPPVIFLNGEQTFRLLQKLGGLPEIKIMLKSKKRSFKDFLIHALSPKTCKRYLFTAFLLIGSSFFMPSSLYYIVIAAICIVLTILSKLNIAARIHAH